MRRTLIVLLPLLALVAILWVVIAGTGAAARPGTPGSGPGVETPPAPAREPSLESGRPPVATEPRTVVEAGGVPTAHLLLIDRSSGLPVHGVVLFRFQGGARLAVSDADGIAPLVLDRAQQLVAAADGYLFRLCATRPGSTVENPQRVEILPDRFTHPMRFVFRGPEGAPVPEVAVQFRPQGDMSDVPPPVADARAGPTVIRAWTEHTLIASTAEFAGERLQLGRANQGKVHRLLGEDTVRFAHTGIFQLQAATDHGLVGRVDAFSVQSGDDEPLVVEMRPGEFVSGVVVRADAGQPLGAALVRVQGGDPLQLAARSDAAGRFRLGPLSQRTVVLEVQHAETEDAVHGPVAPGAGEVRIALRPLQTEVFRGRVRARPALTPVAGAVVAVVGHAGQTIQTRTDQDGRFKLRFSDDSTRLSIALRGYMNYSELIDLEQRYLEFELIPDGAEARVQAGMTALLAGVVVDVDGRVEPNMPVRLQPERPTVPQGIAGRRVLTGGILSLPTVTTTDPNGAFRIETQHAGSARIFPVDGVTRAEEGQAIQVRLGTSVGDLRLQSRRKK